MSKLFIEYFRILTVQGFLQRFHVGIGILKQPQLKFQFQNSPDGTIDHFHGKLSRFHGGFHLICKTFRPRVFHIQPRLYGQITCLFKTVRHTERVYQTVHRHIIRYHNPLKTHLIPQNICQKPLGRHNGFPVHGTIRAHNATHTRFRDGTLKRLAVNFFQVPGRNHIAPHVDTALGDTVPHIVFGRSCNAFPQIIRLNASHKSAGHGGCQSRILSIGLRHPAPSGISCNIHHR